MKLWRWFVREVCGVFFKCRCVFSCLCAAGGGVGGMSSVSRIGSRVSHLQRDPQHAAEWRRGLAGSDPETLTPTILFVFKRLLLKSLPLSNLCFIVVYVLIKDFLLPEAEQKEKWPSSNPHSGFICIYFCFFPNKTARARQTHRVFMKKIDFLLKKRSETREACSEPLLSPSLRVRWRGSGSSIFGFKEREAKKNTGGLQVVFEEVSFFPPSLLKATHYNSHPTLEGSAEMPHDSHSPEVADDRGVGTKLLSDYFCPAGLKRQQQSGLNRRQHYLF